MVVEVEGTRIAITNKESLFKNKLSRSKLEKSRRNLVGRDTMAILPTNQQTIIKHL